MPPIAPPLATELIVVPSDGNIFTTAITDGLVIGRSDSADIVLGEPWLGRRHVLFDWTTHGLRVTNLGAGSGTWMGEQLIDQRQLAVGDVVIAGQTPLLFQHTLPAPPWFEDARELLDVIRAEPDDDDARLVYADWLASRDPVRGEFIACQIAASRGSAAAAARAAELECVELAAPLAIPVESWTFERGFLASVRILHFHSGDRLREDHPLREVRTIHYPPPPFRR